MLETFSLYFQHDFPSHIVKKNKKKTGLLQSYQLMIYEEGGYQQNPFWGPRRLFKQFSTMSDIYIYPPPLFPRQKKSFTVLDTGQNRSNSANRLSLAVD